MPKRLLDLTLRLVLKRLVGLNLQLVLKSFVGLTLRLVLKRFVGLTWRLRHNKVVGLLKGESTPPVLLDQLDRGKRVASFFDQRQSHKHRRSVEAVSAVDPDSALVGRCDRVSFLFRAVEKCIYNLEPLIDDVLAGHLSFWEDKFLENERRYTYFNLDVFFCE